MCLGRAFPSTSLFLGTIPLKFQNNFSVKDKQEKTGNISDTGAEWTKLMSQNFSSKEFNGP
jgi:hypothetical protein